MIEYVRITIALLVISLFAWAVLGVRNQLYDYLGGKLDNFLFYVGCSGLVNYYAYVLLVVVIDN